jgi:hypothetical protein
LRGRELRETEGSRDRGRDWEIEGERERETERRGREIGKIRPDLPWVDADKTRGRQRLKFR